MARTTALVLVSAFALASCGEKQAPKKTPNEDASNAAATTPEEYLGGTADFRTDLYVDDAKLMTHAESIELFKSLGAGGVADAFAGFRFTEW